jgi:hypothetical protein
MVKDSSITITREPLEPKRKMGQSRNRVFTSCLLDNEGNLDIGRDFMNFKGSQ